MRISCAERGFTLVEVLVGIGLVSLIVGSSVLLLGPGRERAALAAEVRDIAVWLERGRAQALMRRETVLLTVLSQGTTARDAGQRSVRLPVTLQGARQAEVSFHPDGGASGGVILLGVGDRQSSIAIDAITGRVQVLEKSNAR